MSPAVTNSTTEGATVVSDVGAADGEEVVVSGILSVHHNLTLCVGGGGYGDTGSEHVKDDYRAQL